MALTLRSLTWSYINTSMSPYLGSSVPVYTDMLESLCGYLPHLEILSIQVQHPVLLHEDDLCQFAPHWPGLKKLELPLRHYLMPDAEAIRAQSRLPSAIGLAAIARHCTSLKYLALELSDDWTINDLSSMGAPTDPVASNEKAQESSTTSVIQTIQHQRCPVERLYLTINEPIADPHAFAEFIDSLFPDLDVDYCDARFLSEEHDGYKQMRGMWKAVERLQGGRAEDITDHGDSDSSFQVVMGSPTVPIPTPTFTLRRVRRVVHFSAAPTC
ncbi:hypothetical protein BD311DRAFT_782786 [Dichomitus squalens]|uniref:F-box domain-containing protein n=1 Tax=Dichomitus squalens TaxID=114155 RepID=A0A4Q9M5V1_9APHY|nr:hypothetical protein BD311DRAFT_782786 [Dichomitus squalens]